MNVRALPACHWASLGLAGAKQYSLRDESHRVQGVGLLPVSQGVAAAEFEARVEFRPFFPALYRFVPGEEDSKETPKFQTQARCGDEAAAVGARHANHIPPSTSAPSGSAPFAIRLQQQYRAKRPCNRSLDLSLG